MTAVKQNRISPDDVTWTVEESWERLSDLFGDPKQWVSRVNQETRSRLGLPRKGQAYGLVVRFDPEMDKNAGIVVGNNRHPTLFVRTAPRLGGTRNRLSKEFPNATVNVAFRMDDGEAFLHVDLAGGDSGRFFYLALTNLSDYLDFLTNAKTQYIFVKDSGTERQHYQPATRKYDYAFPEDLRNVVCVQEGRLGYTPLGCGRACGEAIPGSSHDIDGLIQVIINTITLVAWPPGWHGQAKRAANVLPMAQKAPRRKSTPRRK